MHILVIDDNADLRELLAVVLRLEGYVVKTAADGAQGLACVHREAPQLIITDLAMPMMSGVDLIRRLRQTPGLEAVKIIVLTAATRQEAAQAIDAGAYTVLFKPQDFDVLIDIVRHLAGSPEFYSDGPDIPGSRVS